MFTSFLLSVFTLFSFNQPTQAQLQADVHYSPNNTEFMFDLDDVVMDKRVGKAVRKHLGPLLRNLFNFKLHRRIRKLPKGATAQEYIELFEKYGYKRLARLTREILYNKHLMPGTVAIIKKLHELGYTLHTATNMNKEYLDYYVEKNKNTKEFFKMFDKKKCVDLEKGDAKKPNIKYFEDALENYTNGKPNKIFIDDKRENIQTAENTGKIKGIQFKNPKQLAEELKALGILPEDFDVAKVAVVIA